MTTDKLYLHIGPPKTATTSLQLALQEADPAKTVYGGTFQPRDNNAGSIAQLLHKAASGRLASGDLDVCKALDEIGELILRAGGGG